MIRCSPNGQIDLLLRDVHNNRDLLESGVHEKDIIGVKNAY